MSIDVHSLAILYNKPVEYVERCIKFHGITELPRYRVPDDGYGPFFSDMTAHFSDEPSRTKQEFTDECDINNIIARFKASGGDPSSLPLTSKKARYGDFTDMPDSYHAALNYVKDTERSFLTLDAGLRARFDNDPQRFLDFVADPANMPELVKLGLATLVDIPAPSAPRDAGDGGGVSTPLPDDAAPSKKAAKGSKGDD